MLRCEGQQGQRLQQPRQRRGDSRAYALRGGACASRRRTAAAGTRASSASSSAGVLSQPGPSGCGEAPPNAPPIVVLPAFGNDAQDYTAPPRHPNVALCSVLEARGWDVCVCDIRRRDWLNVARSIFHRGYWSGSLTTNPGYSWYLEKVAQKVDEARRKYKSDQVNLVAHSAGGWLGRAFLADPTYMSQEDRNIGGPNSAVKSLVTLGSPHAPPAPGSGGKCMTGGALSWVDRTIPGAYFSDHGVRYISVAGRAVKGCRKAVKGSPQRFAYHSYTQVCGEGQGVEGDAVVPMETAMLSGAINLVVDGVYHAMNGLIGSAHGWGETAWYGSPEVVDSWLYFLMEEDSCLPDVCRLYHYGTDADGDLNSQLSRGSPQLSPILT